MWKVRQPVGPLLHRPRPQRAPSPGLSGAQRTRAAWVSAHTPPLRGPRAPLGPAARDCQPGPSSPDPTAAPLPEPAACACGHCQSPTSRARWHGGRLSINRDCDGCCRFCIALPSPPPSPTGRRFLLQMQSSSAARRPCTPLWLWPAFVPAPAQTGPRAVPTGSQAGSGAQVGCLVPPAGLTPSGQRREGALPLSSRPCSAQLLPQSCPEHIGGSRTYTQALPGPQ